MQNHKANNFQTRVHRLWVQIFILVSFVKKKI